MVKGGGYAISKPVQLLPRGVGRLGYLSCGYRQLPHRRVVGHSARQPVALLRVTIDSSVVQRDIRDS
jgi:hypothetical protein